MQRQHSWCTAGTSITATTPTDSSCAWHLQQQLLQMPRTTWCWCHQGSDMQCQPAPPASPAIGGRAQCCSKQRVPPTDQLQLLGLQAQRFLHF